MKQRGDVWNWTLLFSAIALFAAFYGARMFTLISYEQTGHEVSGQGIFSGLCALVCMFYAGVVCLVASASYSLLTRQTAPFMGFLFAAGFVFPLMVLESFLMLLVGLFFDATGFKALPFNAYDLRLIVPTLFLVFAFIRKPRALPQG